MKASERAYAVLRAEIIEWQLVPGTVLGEVQQAARLGVSRTPLREALSRLIADGLATAQRGRGVVVSDVSLTRLEELFELREALESKAAALAAQRGERNRFATLRERFAASHFLLGDDALQRRRYYDLATELDTAIDAAACSPFLERSLEGLRTHMVRLRRLLAEDVPRLRQSAAEHAAIAGAIAQGDVALAAAATSVHLSNSLNHIKSKQHNSGFRKATHG
ncbi:MULTISPECIES: GntR family transcriptional regulator [unclassified Arthrobacter]|uniref:GntR family transcriptional regulator n=1 Tax=unclassified Arthrobacter TaxID=235627 RepID=UPI002882DDEB|nr:MULTISPECIES: GntR family transcriptional regulator [unclassified Arthrobacter]